MSLSSGHEKRGALSEERSTEQPETERGKVSPAPPQEFRPHAQAREAERSALAAVTLPASAKLSRATAMRGHRDVGGPVCGRRLHHSKRGLEDYFL